MFVWKLILVVDFGLFDDGSGDRWTVWTLKYFEIVFHNWMYCNPVNSINFTLTIRKFKQAIDLHFNFC